MDIHKVKHWGHVLIPDRGILQLWNQYSAAPGHQVALCGHLAPRGITVHLANPLDLPTATETHIGWGVYLCGRAHRS